jgi:beta-glucosidase
VVSRDLEADVAYPITIEFVHDYASRFIYLRLAMARTYREGEDRRIEQAAALAKASDVAVIFAGMPKGFESEGHDRPNMVLPGPQEALIRAVADANPNTVVVLNCGAPVEMPWVDAVPTLLLAYYPGQECGNALAHILMGDVNPSGKLPVTFPKRLQDNPTYINYPGYREVRYGEGIFVGYRYYDMKDVEPLFPFGFGLSYTTFAYADLTAPEKADADDEIKVAVTVENTGERAGQEVVQLYVRDKEATLARPVKELKRFQKVVLQPGERARVEFVLDRRAFAFYDPHEDAWVVEPGDFEILLGSSSRDIRARATLMLE